MYGGEASLKHHQSVGLGGGGGRFIACSAVHNCGPAQSSKQHAGESLPLEK